MIDHQEVKRLTDLHMRDPQIGDRFHEMYSWWVYVVDRQGDDLVVAEGCACPKDFPATATFTTTTVQEFVKKNAYQSIPGYTVDYCDTDPEVVKGWMAK